MSFFIQNKEEYQFFISPKTSDNTEICFQNSLPYPKQENGHPPPGDARFHIVLSL